MASLAGVAAPAKLLGRQAFLAMMNPFGCVLLAIMLSSSASIAATTECRFINSRKERNACYEKNAAAKQAPKAPHRARMEDTIDRLKIENDRLNMRLKGICRGC